MDEPKFTRNVIAKMAKLGLSEAKIMDVWWHGAVRNMPSGMEAVVRAYNGYEVGVTYIRDKTTGEFVLTGCWIYP